MRAREFIREEKQLPPESAEPMRYTYTIPGLSAADPYKNYRFGVAIARARSDAAPDDVNPNRPVWSPDTAFGEHGVVVGMNSGIEKVIDVALKMTGTPGGKKIVSSPKSEEPDFVKDVSPIKGFKGY